MNEGGDVVRLEDEARPGAARLLSTCAIVAAFAVMEGETGRTVCVSETTSMLLPLPMFWGADAGVVVPVVLDVGLAVGE